MKNLIPSMLVAGSLLGLALPLGAQTPEAKEKYSQESKLASDRYKSDQGLCNGEATSSLRMQCKRDAKAEYDQAMSRAKLRLVPAKQSSTLVSSCSDCAEVSAVSETEKAGEGSAVGLISGGVVGAILGHQIGGGFGKDLATVTGAAGGAYAGKHIEGKLNPHKVWTVTVRQTSGAVSNFQFSSNPGYKVGDLVRIENNRLVRP